MTQTVLLGDIVKVQNGHAFSSKIFTDAGHPVVKIKNIDGTRVDLKDTQYIDEKVFSKLANNFKLSFGDVVIAMTGAKVGKLGIVPETTQIPVLNQRVGKLIARGNPLDAYFAYILLSMPDFQAKILGAAAGSAQPNISSSDLEAIRIPDLSPKQRSAITLAIKTIDEKIELNRQMNETLEQMGQALFRHYFIDNPEAEMLGEATVDEFVDHLKIPVLPMKSPNVIFRQYSIPGYDNSHTPEFSSGDTIKSGKYRVEPNSILVSKLNPATPRIWAVLEPKENAVCSTEFQVIVPKKYYAFCYFLLTSKDYTDKMAMSAGGTSNSHRRIKPGDILNYFFPKPNNETLHKFERQAVSMLEAIEQNREQIQTLITLRDTLLPRLINGKIKL